MIARIWSAVTTSAQAPAYAAHLHQRVLPEVQALGGYSGAMLLKRTTQSGVEFIVITWWTSLNAIRAFAGADVERAVVADEAAAVLTQYDRRVRHYEVVVQDSPGHRSAGPAR